MISFDRACKVTVYRQPSGFIGENPAFFEELGNGVEITAHRIQFKVVKNLASEPNTAEVTLYNFSETSRSAFQDRPLRVHLEAGHANAPRLLFVGDVRPGSGSTLVGTEWITKLRLGDGTRAFAEARVNRSYRPGTPVRAILRDAAHALGLAMPRDIDASPELAAQVATGEVLSGYASDELTRMLAPYGYTWSIQNGRLQVLRDEQVIGGAAIVLEQPPEGGMLGTPTMKVPEPGKPTKSGKARKSKKRPSLTVPHILDGRLAPGMSILPRARSIDGLFKIWRVTHEGDTHGPAWNTELEARPQ